MSDGEAPLEETGVAATLGFRVGKENLLITSDSTIGVVGVC